jgi:ATPase subunit of ABC transporter with duplicated ATPase domains
MIARQPCPAARGLATFHGMDPDLLLADLLAGKTAAMARAITMVENGRPGFERLLAGVHPSLGRARRVGITGPPGAGKSTLVERLVGVWRAAGLRVAVNTQINRLSLPELPDVLETVIASGWGGSPRSARTAARSGGTRGSTISARRVAAPISSASTLARIRRIMRRSVRLPIPREDRPSATLPSTVDTMFATT